MYRLANENGTGSRAKSTTLEDWARALAEAIASTDKPITNRMVVAKIIEEEVDELIRLGRIWNAELLQWRRSKLTDPMRITCEIVDAKWPANSTQIAYVGLGISSSASRDRALISPSESLQNQMP